MPELNAEIAAAFKSVHGRRPSFQEMLLFKEAAYSVALDKDMKGGTSALDEVDDNREVVSETGGYTVQGPAEADWRDDEIKRLKGLLGLSLDVAEKVWREGWDTRDRLVGKVKSPDPDRYNPYSRDDDEVGEE